MLNGTHVQGTIKVEMNATLYASNVEVVGNVQAENAARVEMLPGSVVSGSIQIVQSVAALVDSVWINGDLFLNANESSLTVTKNRIGGNLQVFQNTGGVTIADNIIEGNLQCKENDPAPTGEGNLVKGNIEDQCVGLGVELKHRMFLPLLGLIAYAPGTGAPETTIDSGPDAATEGTGATFPLSGNVPLARADDTLCRGTLGAVSVDNLKVPDKATCTLNGTQVRGNIIVGTGATLRAKGVAVDGNLQAEGARSVTVTSGSVGGSVQIKQGGSASLSGVRIKADLQLESNRGKLTISKSRIGSNLQAFQNTGGLKLTNNWIAQNMQCKENNPPPTGGGNTAGDKEDQCAGL